MDFKLIKPYIGKSKDFVFKNFNYTVGCRLQREGVGVWVDTDDKPKKKVTPKAEAKSVEKPKKAVKSRKKAQ